MNPPPFEVADIVRARSAGFIEKSRRWLHWSHVKVLNAVARCRTAALGGHRDQCPRCGHEIAISYNSCRDRHCPKCQTAERNRWVAQRQAEILPVGYFHVVFTLPHEFSALALQNKKLIYGLLFRATAETLLEVAANPEHLGAALGFLSILHSWGQNLLHHPHLHCVVPAGGISPDRQRWIPTRPNFLLPIPVLKEVFRGKFLDGVMRLFRAGKLLLTGELVALRSEKAFRSFLKPLGQKEWVVYAKAPFRGPDHLLQYLARYTHRVAISNHRLLAFDGESVTFRWKDYAHGNKKRKMTLSADEFLRRFLLHTLPPGFVRIRSFGFLAGPNRAALLRLGPTTVAATYRCKRFAAVHSGARVVPVPYLLHTDDRGRTALTSHGPPHRASGGTQRLFLNPAVRWTILSHASPPSARAGVVCRYTRVLHALLDVRLSSIRPHAHRGAIAMRRRYPCGQSRTQRESENRQLLT